MGRCPSMTWSTSPGWNGKRPVNADLAGLPPLYIQVSGDETLLDDGLDVAAVAARAGVEVRLDVFPGMQHVFQYCAGAMPEATDAIARLGAWVAALK